MATAVQAVPMFRRVQRKLRSLDRSYLGAEDKSEVQHALEAALEELRWLHTHLPYQLREKSWLLMIERYGG